MLLAIDLANVAGTATAGPYGIAEIGSNSGLGVGWSSAIIGDVAGTGFQNMLVGAPTIRNTTGFPLLGTGANSQAYLIFGSNQSTAGGPGTTVDWRTLTATQRIGTISQLGNSQQTSPLTGLASFPFNGLIFFTSQQSNSLLGASVADIGDVNGDGFGDFMIGAPGGLDALNTPGTGGTGRAYIIYGGANLTSLSNTNNPIDLDNPPANFRMTTIVGLALPGAHIGASVAGIGGFIADGNNYIAVGAPDATITGANGQGAVYVISTAALRGATPPPLITVNQVGQTGGVAGLTIVGANAGDAAGWSIAAAGNTAGRLTSTSQQFQDLLIGAPGQNLLGQASRPGAAYLVYGQLPQNFQPLLVTTNGVTVLPLARVGQTGTTAIPGGVFNGDLTGDATGYSVWTAGDFNADGIADFQIGSPGWTNFQGRDSVIMGIKATTANPFPLNGVFTLSSLPSTVSFVEFDGASNASLAGFSVTAVRKVNTDPIPANDIAIGSPGANLSSGAVYLIPGNPDLFGVQNLANNETQPIQGLTIALSQLQGQPTGVPNLVGSSVAGNLNASSAGATLDSDTLGDLIVGSAGLTPSTSATLVGAAFGLEGTFLPLPNIVSSAITVQIGIDQPFGPFTNINPTTPADMKIYVFSDATLNPPFAPLTQLDPTTVVVNGVPFPTATITDAGDLNNDGIEDVFITINPRTALGLQPGQVTTITLDARTFTTGVNANRRVTGTANISVAGGGGGSGGLPAFSGPLFGLSSTNVAIPPYGSRFLPSPNVVYGNFNWVTLKPHKAFSQFLPKPKFITRFNWFYHPPKKSSPLGSSGKKNQGYRTTTLGNNIFTRGKYPQGVYDARQRLRKK